LELDGTNVLRSADTFFTTGLVVEGGTGNTIKKVTAFSFAKSGVLLSSKPGASLIVEIRVDEIITHTNGGTISGSSAGQGYAVSSENAEDVISIGSALTYSNGIFGFDYSLGISDTGSIVSHSNGTLSTGGGGKFAGTGANRTTIGSMVTRDNTGTGFNTNGIQDLVHIGMLDCNGNSTNGVQISHAGNYNFDTCRVEGNTNNGMLIEAGNVNISSFQADGNGSNGASVSLVGNLSIDVADTKNHTAGAGIIGSGTRSVNIRKISSNEDVNGAVRLVGASEEYRIGEVFITATTAYVGVFLNTSPLGAIVGKITTAGSAVEISDAAADTKREGVSGLDNGVTDYKSSDSGITAHAGGGQANAFSLVAEINEISIVATIADSVELLSAAPGIKQTIFNNGANAMDVFPKQGASDNIGAGVDTAVSLAAGASVTYAAYDSTNYRSV